MVNPMTMNHDNPYSAPTAEPPAKRSTTHHEFQLTEKGIRCRAGLELPKICLVTGSIENLQRHRIVLSWTSKLARIVIIGASVLTAMLPAAIFINLQFPNTPLHLLVEGFQSTKWLPLLWICIVQLVLVSTVVLTPRGVLTAYVHQMVRRRQRKQMVFMVTCATILVAVVGANVVRIGTLTMSVVPMLLFILVLGLVVLLFRRISLRISQTEFPGVKLKTIGFQSGQFEVTGFTSEYLETLQRQRGNVDS